MKNHKLIKIKQEKCAKCCSGFRLILHSAHYFVTFLQIIFRLNHNLRILILFFRFFAVE